MTSEHRERRYLQTLAAGMTSPLFRDPRLRCSLPTKLWVGWLSAALAGLAVWGFAWWLRPGFPIMGEPAGIGILGMQRLLGRHGSVPLLTINLVIVIWMNLTMGLDFEHVVIWSCHLSIWLGFIAYVPRDPKLRQWWHRRPYTERTNRYPWSYYADLLGVRRS